MATGSPDDLAEIDKALRNTKRNKLFNDLNTWISASPQTLPKGYDPPHATDGTDRLRGGVRGASPAAPDTPLLGGAGRRAPARVPGRSRGLRAAGRHVCPV